MELNFLTPLKASGVYALSPLGFIKNTFLYVRSAVFWDFALRTVLIHYRDIENQLESTIIINNKIFILASSWFFILLYQ